MIFVNQFFVPAGWINSALGRPESPARPKPSAHDRRAAKLTARDILLECDPSACESEYGAQMLMAMFPREM